MYGNITYHVLRTQGGIRFAKAQKKEARVPSEFIKHEEYPKPDDYSILRHMRTLAYLPVTPEETLKKQKIINKLSIAALLN